MAVKSNYYCVVLAVVILEIYYQSYVHCIILDFDLSLKIHTSKYTHRLKCVHLELWEKLERGNRQKFCPLKTSSYTVVVSLNNNGHYRDMDTIIDIDT